MREIPKRPLEDLAVDIANSPHEIGTTFRHHSGDRYTLLKKVIDCKTNQLMAVYLREDPVCPIEFTRPLADFVEPRFVPE